MLAGENQLIADWLQRITCIQRGSALWLELQAGLPDLSGARVEDAYKTQEVIGAWKAGGIGSARPAQPVLVDGFYAQAT